MTGRLPSKLRKNENSTDISLYQIYLRKLYENILKHYGLDLIKEITSGFTHGLLMTSDSPASLFDRLLL